jgi:hypothetical protein
MSLLTTFSPPAFLPDFQGIPGQAEAWHRAVYGWFESSIRFEQSSVRAEGERSPGIVQFYNPAKFDPGPLVEQAIVWNAFPKELLKQYGPTRALVEADRLFTLDHYSKTLTDQVALNGHLIEQRSALWNGHRDVEHAHDSQRLR